MSDDVTLCDVPVSLKDLCEVIQCKNTDSAAEADWVTDAPVRQFRNNTSVIVVVKCCFV